MSRKKSAVFEFSDNLLTNIITNSPVVTYICKTTDDYGALFVSDNIYSQLGYHPSDFIEQSEFWANHIHPDDREKVLANVPGIFTTGSMTHEYRFLAADGRYRWMRDELSVYTDEESNTSQIIGYWYDITESISHKLEIEEKNKFLGIALERAHHLQSIMDNLIDGVITIDESGVIQSFNNSAEKLFGYQRNEIVGKRINRLMPEPYASQHDSYLSHYLETGDAKILGIGPREVVGLHKNGAQFPLDLATSEVILNGSRLFIGIVRDITERKSIHERLVTLAKFDQLTGLANRATFLELLELSISHVIENNHTVTIFYLDLDRFKLVNDSLGHAAGDSLLKHASRRLLRCIGNKESIVRLGGDEFAILLEGVSEKEAVCKIANKIIDEFRVPFNILNRKFVVGVSIGIINFPLDEENVESLLKGADLAMYEAKRAGGNTYQFYTKEMSEALERRIHIESILRSALQKNQFAVYYQPQFDLQTGKIVGVEALLRLKTEEGDFISPLEFVPALEETGLIIGVGAWILEQACSDINRWNNSNSSNKIKVSVNLSVIQLKDLGLLDLVKKVLNSTGLQPELLTLEITESALMDNPDYATQIFKKLREMGANISIDDFGTGYSSLAYLQRFSIQTLKLDREFVKDIPDNKDSIEIAKAILALSKSLNLEVVAEGAEEIEQINFLKDEKCEYVQGFYYCKPLPYNELVPYLMGLENTSANDQ